MSEFEGNVRCDGVWIGIVGPHFIEQNHFKCLARHLHLQDIKNSQTSETSYTLELLLSFDHQCHGFQ